MQWLINEQKSASANVKKRSVEQASLSIGRGTNQTIQSTASNLALHHATLQATPRGIQVTAIDGTGLSINQRRSRGGLLQTGDRLTIANLTIIVDDITNNAITLTVAHAASTTDLPNNASRSRQMDLQTTWLSSRLLAWLLFVSIGLFFLALPLWALYNDDLLATLHESPLPDTAAWDTGPVHRSHEHLQCNDCHAEPFALVKDEQCLTCHTGVNEHIPEQLHDSFSRDNTAAYHEIGSPFAEQLAVLNPRLDDMRCATCHHEHNPISNLARRDQALCADCHSRLSEWPMTNETTISLRNVDDFASSHPDFRYTVFTRDEQNDLFQPRRFDRTHAASTSELSEYSGLKFPHNVHLANNGIKAPTGTETLECNSCHVPDVTGFNMQPIQMEQDCQRCHTLSFDPDFPSREAPHGDPQMVAQTLTEYFSYKLLAGDAANPQLKDVPAEILPNPLADVRRPGGIRSNPNVRPNRPIPPLPRVQIARTSELFTQAQATSKQVMTELLERRACNTCHEVAIDRSKTDLEQYSVLRVELTDTWLPKAHFDHASHQQAECSTCHSAESSSTATDVLMPDIAVCQTCHGGDNVDVGGGLLASECLMCHQFHNQNLPRMQTTMQKAIQTEVQDVGINQTVQP